MSDVLVRDIKGLAQVVVHDLRQASQINDDFFDDLSSDIKGNYQGIIMGDPHALKVIV